MSRDQAKNNLIAIGISEPTEEQITNYLNQVGGETKREKELAEKYKGDSLKVRELEAQLEEIANKNLSDVELAKKETEKANTRVNELEKTLALLQRKNKLAEKGIVGEIADKLIDANGSLDIDILGQLIADREALAKSQAEKALLGNTPDPTGGNKGNEASEFDTLATNVGKEIASMNQTTSDILKHYI